MSRYQRHIQLAEIGEKGQQKLAVAKVLVVGAGGLGCPALQYLAAAGVGYLEIIDSDVVSLSNLQRQILFDAGDIGKNKAVVAKKKLEKLNPEIEISARPVSLSPANWQTIIPDFDLVLDCSDNFVTRYLINDACIKLNKPFIHGSLYKFEGQLSVFNYKNGPSYRCLFPIPPEKGDVPNCNEIGVLGVLPGIIGLWQATEALKIILDLGEILCGKVMHYDLLSQSQQTFSFSRNESEIQRILAQESIIPVSTADCDFNRQISYAELMIDEPFVLIDVREPYEKPKLNHPSIVNIPLAQLAEKAQTLINEDQKILFCQSGIRSKQALSILTEQNIPNVFILREVAEDLVKIIKP